MENNQTFQYRYSAAQSREAELIRQKYLPREVNKLDQLRALDFRVQTAGMIQAICLGVIGALIFGIGLCFGLDVFTGADWIALVFCIIGASVMLPAYPLFRYLSHKTKSALTPQILQLTDEIIKP